MLVIDSHTGGQPTRVIIDGGPNLGQGSLAKRADLFANNFDVYRRQCVLEPKCSEAMVGALLCEPENPECSAGVIFFNTSGYLGMCGHGTIGLLVTLAHLGRIEPGRHLIETPVGIVETELVNKNEAKIINVESYCFQENVQIDVEGLGPVSGHVAWGGNWFFLIENSPYALTVNNIPKLTQVAMRIRHALVKNGVCGRDGAEIDHIEIFQPILDNGANSRSFVLCPGGAYDRSPCGTGTSAKLACLARKSVLASGDIWIQESIIGSRFKASYVPAETPGHIIPTIAGNAYVFGETKLVFDPHDPFRDGIEL